MKTLNYFELEECFLGQLIAENIKTAFIFEKYGIQLYGNRSLTVKELKNDKNIDYDNLLEELIKSRTLKDVLVDFKNASTDLIIEYIEQYHHQQVRKNLPNLLNMGKSLSQKFGQEYQLINDLYALIYAVAEDLFTHMDMEEKKLFPIVRAVIHYKDEFCNIKDVFREKLSVASMEHEEASGLIKKINNLCDSCNPPSAYGKPVKDYFKLLRLFIDDMFEHILIEEQVLFPRLVSLI